MGDTVYNSTGGTWIEYGIALGISIFAQVLGACVRFLSAKVLRIDTEQALLERREDQDSEIIVGASPLLTLLGAPHLIRTGTKRSFVALWLIVLSTIALSIAPGAFSGSRRLRSNETTVKVTAEPGNPVLDEDLINSHANWIRSAGVISFCQRKEGAKRVYYQPFVEQSADTRVFCGKKLDVSVVHELEESIERVRPSQLEIDRMNGVRESTPHSAYFSHRINILGTGLRAVCNSGLYYRSVRDGRVAQSCAFTSTTTFFLGGYYTNSSKLSGPGDVPSIDDIVYFDSYATNIGTELTKAQLAQAVTLWDLGDMSEVEVAVLATLQLKMANDVPSFSGGWNSYEYDLPIIVTTFAVVVVAFLTYFVLLAWFNFRNHDRLHLETNVATVDFISRTMAIEAEPEQLRRYGLAQDDDLPNSIAIREVPDQGGTQENPNPDRREVLPRLHLGSASLGNPVRRGVTTRQVVNTLNG